jgi:hypothetical protein
MSADADRKAKIRRIRKHLREAIAASERLSAALHNILPKAERKTKRRTA